MSLQPYLFNSVFVDTEGCFGSSSINWQMLHLNLLCKKIHDERLILMNKLPLLYEKIIM